MAIHLPVHFNTSAEAQAFIPQLIAEGFLHTGYGEWTSADSVLTFNEHGLIGQKVLTPEWDAQRVAMGRKSFDRVPVRRRAELIKSQMVHFKAGRL